MTRDPIEVEGVVIPLCLAQAIQSHLASARELVEKPMDPKVIGKFAGSARACAIFFDICMEQQGASSAVEVMG